MRGVIFVDQIHKLVLSRLPQGIDAAYSEWCADINEKIRVGLTEQQQQPQQQQQLQQQYQREVKDKVNAISNILKPNVNVATTITKVLDMLMGHLPGVPITKNHLRAYIGCLVPTMIAGGKTPLLYQAHSCIAYLSLSLFSCSSISAFFQLLQLKEPTNLGSLDQRLQALQQQQIFDDKRRIRQFETFSKLLFSAVKEEEATNDGDGDGNGDDGDEGDDDDPAVALRNMEEKESKQHQVEAKTEFLKGEGEDSITKAIKKIGATSAGKIYLQLLHLLSSCLLPDSTTSAIDTECSDLSSWRKSLALHSQLQPTRVTAGKEKEVENVAFGIVLRECVNLARSGIGEIMREDAETELKKRLDKNNNKEMKLWSMGQDFDIAITTQRNLITKCALKTQGIDSTGIIVGLAKAKLPDGVSNWMTWFDHECADFLEGAEIITKRDAEEFAKECKEAKIAKLEAQINVTLPGPMKRKLETKLDLMRNKVPAFQKESKRRLSSAFFSFLFPALSVKEGVCDLSCRHHHHNNNNNNNNNNNENDENNEMKLAGAHRYCSINTNSPNLWSPTFSSYRENGVTMNMQVWNQHRVDRFYGMYHVEGGMDLSQLLQRLDEKSTICRSRMYLNLRGGKIFNKIKIENLSYILHNSPIISNDFGEVVHASTIIVNAATGEYLRAKISRKQMAAKTQFFKRKKKKLKRTLQLKSLQSQCEYQPLDHTSEFTTSVSVVSIKGTYVDGLGNSDGVEHVLKNCRIACTSKAPANLALGCCWVAEGWEGATNWKWMCITEFTTIKQQQEHLLKIQQKDNLFQAKDREEVVNTWWERIVACCNELMPNRALDPICLIGDGKWEAKRGVTCPCPQQYLFDFLTRRCFCIVVPEWRTSLCCHRCTNKMKQGKDVSSKQDKGMRYKICSHCHSNRNSGQVQTVIDRDENASWNMIQAFLHFVLNGGKSYLPYLDQKANSCDGVGSCQGRKPACKKHINGCKI